MRPDIPALTGLRFVAAFSVLLAHALPKLFPIPEGSAAPLIYGIFQSAASFGMSLFFVLSGFVIHYNYSEKIDRDGYTKFFVARFARLYPLYIVCILWELTIKFGHSQVSASLWVALPFYLTMTQSWVYIVDEKNAIIFQLGIIASVAWSISTEFFFYCVYPAIRTRLKQLTSINQLLGAAFVTGAVTI